MNGNFGGTNRKNIVANQSSIPVQPAPTWITRSKVRDYDRQGNSPVTCLLFEKNVHVPSRTTYSRQVSRLETPQAVQHLSRVEIPFDPLTQSAVVHRISIFRNGELKNHARTEDFEMIRREQRLDAGILNGEISALLLLKDVRTGDILDVEFSISDQTMLFDNEMTSFQSVGNSNSIGEWKFSWIDVAGRVPKIISENTDLLFSEFPVADLVARQWSAFDLIGKEPEAALPPDIFQYPILQVSSFTSYKPIVKSLLDQWNFLPADRSALDDELSIIRADVDKNSYTLIDRAVTAARDSVRYQSYSPGLLGMIPEDLSVVWDRRYGDCKEKSLLLTWLLRENGIDAAPVLVHSSRGKALPRLLPSPGMFDHVITRVILPEKTLWIDPTDLYRGGRPSEWTSLPFSWGLPLVEGATDLVEIPELPIGEAFLKVRETLIPDTKSRSMSVSVEIQSGGRRADWLRGLHDGNGTSGLMRFLKDFMTATRPGIEIIDDPVFEDDREKNLFRISANARIPNAVVQDPEYARNMVSIAPFSFFGALTTDDSLKRRFPISLGSLDRIEHEIKFQHPSITTADYPRRTATNPAFRVDTGSRMDEKFPVYWFSCSILKDRVEAEDYSKYKTQVARAYGIVDITIHLPASGHRNTRSADPENQWGGGIPSPAAARAGARAEGAKIAIYLTIGTTLFIALLRFLMIF